MRIDTAGSRISIFTSPEVDGYGRASQRSGTRG